MKKINKWAGLVVALVVVGGLLLWIGKGRKSRVCDRLVVEILNPPQEPFLTEEEVLLYATQGGQDQVEGKRMDAVSLDALESRVQKNPRVKRCEAYWRLTGTLYLEVEPHIPIARIVRGGNAGFYLDAKGHTFPASNQYTARTLLISGAYVQNRQHLKDSVHLPLRKVIQFICRDPFWSVQITQLDIEKDGYMRAVPLVGDYLIDLGYPTHMDLKWEKLQHYYSRLHDQPSLQPTRRLDVSVGSQLIIE